MSYPPPAINRRPDGLTLTGSCPCPGGSTCALIVSQLPNGTVRLAFHGTSEHSIILTEPQQAALMPLLRGVAT